MAKRKLKKRTPYQELKHEASQLCSYYIRLRDAIKHARKLGLRLDTGTCDCYTCGRVYSVSKMQAGHYLSRDVGGSSGIYFDERGIKTQCKQCNAFRQGRHKEFREHLVLEYGEEVVDELDLKHTVNKYTATDLVIYKYYFVAEIADMLSKSGIKKWWK